MIWYSITLAAGIILLLISLSILKESLTFLRESNRAIATVIELEKLSDSDGDSYRPVLTFRTDKDQEIIYKRHSSSTLASWDVGQQATIVYDPNNPSAARLLTYFNVFSWTIVLMAISMPLIVIGGGYHLSQFVLK